MTQKICPECGAKSSPDARFCRYCGALLDHAPSNAESDGQTSPHGRTAPLTSEPRSTASLPPGTGHPGTAATSRVSKVEMDELLRHAGLPANKPQPETTRVAHDDRLTRADLAASAPPEGAPTATTSELVESAPANLSSLPAPSKGAASPRQARLQASSRHWMITAAVAGCIAVAVMGGIIFLLVRYARAHSRASGLSGDNSAEEHKSTRDQLAEAQSLLAAGETDKAIALLRSIVAADPKNPEAHMRLGEALEESGARADAINEFHEAVDLDPNNDAAWQALASAQFADGRYDDAIESYQKLIKLAGDNELDEVRRLEYADALRLAGRTSEARVIYERLVTSDSQDLAQQAKRHLKEITPPPKITPSPSPTPRNQRTPQPEPSLATDTRTVAAAPSPPPPVVAMSSPAPTPHVATREGDRTVRNDADVYYDRAVRIVGGRDPSQLQRAELVQALEYFQRASQSGTHRAQAAAYADRLGREYDRRKRQPR